ncbi:hypothetical protein VaNZ11_016757 [Volvox africanus]|uniref:Senescence domain-containing protein n=1 Tax=Volvox africanus TaxID=51714 RepID=A0ABQ5SPZ4_9CHLO|nr:hypothetical protein VaNZ11_016757 [Volvox africanus]
MALADVGEVLVRVPNATLYQVERATHAVTSITNGDFTISYLQPSSHTVLRAQVGSVRWSLDRGVAALCFNDFTYAFQLLSQADESNTVAVSSTGISAGAAPAAAVSSNLPTGFTLGCCYYCLTLQPDTPLELTELLQAVLASGTAYHDHQHVQQQRERQAPIEGGGPAMHGRAQQSAPLDRHQPQDSAPVQTVTAHCALGSKTGPSSTSVRADRIATGLQRGGQLAAAGVLVAAGWAGAVLQHGAEAVVARTQPSDRQHSLTPQVQARLERAKAVASQTAEVSGRVMAGALSMTATVAGHLADRISDSDLGRRINNSRVAGASAHDLRRVGVAGVEAMEAIYNSLEDAARLVLAHIHTAATRVAGHKYGPGAAQATDIGMQVTHSIVETGLNVCSLRPTALIKKTLQGTAKDVVRGPGTQQQPPEQQPSQPQEQVLAPRQQQRVSCLSAPPAQMVATGIMVPTSAMANGACNNIAAVTPSASVQVASITGGSMQSARRLQQHEDAATAGECGSGPGIINHCNDGVVDGVPWAGPSLGQPMVFAAVESTPHVMGSRSIYADTDQNLQYPPVSESRYTARYYPAVPRT